MSCVSPAASYCPAGWRSFRHRQARLKAEAQRVKARARETERKRETRRLILYGAMLKDRMARGAVSEKLILADMDQFLTRDHERALFGLTPRQNREKEGPQA